MNELIQMLVSQVGINQKQAEGAVGLLLKVAQDKLSADDFSTLSGAIPDALKLLAGAPAAGGSTGAGLGGLMDERGLSIYEPFGSEKIPGFSRACCLVLSSEI